MSPDTSDYTTFCKLQSGLHNACTVQCSLRIFADFTWTFFYCGRQVKSSQTALLADIPVFLNTGVCVCVCVLIACRNLDLHVVDNLVL